MNEMPLWQTIIVGLTCALGSVLLRRIRRALHRNRFMPLSAKLNDMRREGFLNLMALVAAPIGYALRTLS